MKWALLLKPENIGVTMTLIKSMYNLTMLQYCYFMNWVY